MSSIIISCLISFIVGFALSGATRKFLKNRRIKKLSKDKSYQSKMFNLRFNIPLE